jgi:ribonuclease BN (tRNA processing enzyme)
VGEDISRTYGHLNPRQACDVAREAGAARVVLTHYAGLDAESAMMDDARGSGFAGEISLARDGDVARIRAGYEVTELVAC